MSPAPSKTVPQRRRPYRMGARAKAAAATAERLLQAAWEQFASRPYEDVRLTDVATAAGVSAQTLHLRFGSKEELFAAAFAHWGLAEVSAREEAPVDDPAAAITNLFDHYEHHGAAILRMLSQEERIPAVAEMTEAGRAYHRAWSAKTFAPLLAGLRGGRRAARTAAILAATDVSVWKVLRLDTGLSREEAEAAVVVMLGEPEKDGGSGR
jgi:AcrR family transcriptional regulator